MRLGVWYAEVVLCFVLFTVRTISHTMVMADDSKQGMSLGVLYKGSIAGTRVRPHFPQDSTSPVLALICS